MDFAFDQEEAAFYQEVDEFIRKELPQDWVVHDLAWPGGYGTRQFKSEESRRIAEQFRRKLWEKGWYTSSWPRKYGGKEFSIMKQAIFDERFSYYRVSLDDAIATGMVGPTILRFGTEENKREWLPRIASGEVFMWLAYSEPNAGSDLSRIQTTAIEDGDDFVINGQKVWSSYAHKCQYAWLIARTDPDAPPHKGISYFIVDNKAPGITMRPIVNIVGIHHFNEVYFDNVRVPRRNLIGEKNKGFYYLMTSLDFERVVLVGIGGFKRFFEDLMTYVKETARDGKPLGNCDWVRKKLVQIALRIEIGYLYVWKVAKMLDRGLSPTIEASSLKVIASELSRQLAEAAIDIMGPYGLLEMDSKWAPFRGMAARGFIDCISATIGAGTSEINRNIIATRGLGLPRV
jgi:3-oxocholest-4-en-26-oyl-CoA dehydrogenase alpha subunit